MWSAAAMPPLSSDSGGMAAALHIDLARAAGGSVPRVHEVVAAAPDGIALSPVTQHASDVLFEIAARRRHVVLSVDEAEPLELRRAGAVGDEQRARGGDLEVLGDDVAVSETVGERGAAGGDFLRAAA